MSLKLNTDGTITLENVVAVEQFGEIQYYTTTVSIKELYSIHDKLTYDGEAQRGAIDGKPEIDKSHVQEIYDALIDGNSIRGHLTWNMRKLENGVNFNYDEETGKLKLNNQLITIPDSAHRHEALKMVGEKIDDDSILSSRFSLDIFNLTFTEEKELFSAVNGKAKTPNKNRILYLSNDIECRLLREVIAQSDLDGRIECVRNNAYKDGKLTKFSTLYDSLFGQSGVYGAGHITEENYEEYLTWLTEFYNELLKTRDDFKFLTSEQKSESKQKSMVLEELAWWGYATLAEKLKGARKWKHSLNEKMNKTIKVDRGVATHFLNKSLPIWHATVIKPKYNFITKTQEIGTSVTNSNATRNSIKKIFYITLF